MIHFLCRVPLRKFLWKTYLPSLLPSQEGWIHFGQMNNKVFQVGLISISVQLSSCFPIFEILCDSNRRKYVRQGIYNPWGQQGYYISVEFRCDAMCMTRPSWSSLVQMLLHSMALRRPLRLETAGLYLCCPVSIFVLILASESACKASSTSGAEV